MRIAYSPSTRLYAQGLLRCVRRFLRRALLGFTGFAGALMASLLGFGTYPALGQETADVFVDEPDFMRLRAERYANAQDSLALVDFYHEMGEEYWMDHKDWLEASEKTAGAAVAAHEPDSLALVDFYHAAGGKHWRKRTGWLSAPVMDWRGVTLNEEGRVVRLSMRTNNLTGTISASLGRLAKLQKLWLGWSKLTGTIPSELSNLAELEVLDIEYSGLTGTIPAWLGRLPRLRALLLQGNHFTGSIPPELGNLANLEHLSLAACGLTGSIPASLGRLTKLKELWLGNNSLTGPIPPELGNLANLRTLNFQSNDLSGIIPPSLGNLANLWHFSLIRNPLDPYDFPSWIMKLDKLRTLSLSHTRLRGAIPPALFDLQKLEIIFLSTNDLEGALPDNIGNARALKIIHIHENNLDSLGDFSGLPALSRVSVSLNRLTFEDFEDRDLPASIKTYDYAPQRPVPAHVAYLASHATFSVDVGGAANEYQWYRKGSVNDEAVPGATADRLVVYLPDSPGCYYCKITNAKAPDLTLYSECVSVDEGKRQATPGVEADTHTLSLEEGGAPGSYTLALRTDPGGAVTVTPSSSNKAAATASGALSFDRSNWGTPQTVTVTPVDDADADDETVTITHAVSGYGALTQGPEVRVLVDDDDTRAVEASKRTLSLEEGGASGSYTLALSTDPGDAVIVTPSSSNEAAATVSGALVFDNSNWGTPQTVTVTPVDDADADDETVTITHAVSGYGDLTQGPEVRVLVDDDDTRATSAVEASTRTLSLEEGGGPGSYTLALRTDPGGAVTVTPSSSNKAAATASGALSFDRSNWGTPQTVTVTPVDDADADDETVTITHAVSGYGALTQGPEVRVLVDDDDTRAVEASTRTLSLEEGGGPGSYTLALSTNPGGAVTVTPSSSNEAAATASGALSFDPSNWGTPQTVTVTPLDDTDADDETLTITHAVSGYGALTQGPEVRVLVNDDDTQAPPDVQPPPDTKTPPDVETTPDVQATPDVEASTHTLRLEEGGEPGSYMLALRTDPGGAVTVTPTSSNEESATVSGALAFDPSNWQAPQTVTVTPVDDANLEDDTVTITHAVAGYPGVPVGPVVTVTVADATIIISAEEEEQEIPTAFALEQNYPNPFNPSTTIAFTLNKTQRATLSVYDLLGQKVQTLVDGVRPAARYRIPFDASDLASGTYLYVLRTEEEIAVKTMLLLK